MRNCLIEDSVLYYKGNWNHDSKCRLQIFKTISNNKESYKVLFTELKENPGTSVTNASETLANMVSKKLGHPANIEWYETYYSRTSLDRINYSGMPGEYECASWSPVTMKELNI